MASKIANTISEQYLELISEKNQTKMERSVGFLDEQRKVVEKELDQVLLELKTFESLPGGVAFLEQQFNTKKPGSFQISIHVKRGPGGSKTDRGRYEAGGGRAAENP